MTDEFNFGERRESEPCGRWARRRPTARRSGPLAGVRVIEVAALGALPHAAMLLSDAGADVLRLDRRGVPAAPDDIVERGRRNNAVTRGRRSVGVDLKHPGAVEVVLDLVSRADVFLEGFRPGVIERLGLGPDRCLAANPALVYGRLTGWGREGPLASRAGHDINYLALSGSMGAMGVPDDPPPVPLNLIGDFGGGSMQIAFGVVAALVESAITGVGQVVDAAMVDGIASQTTYIHSMRAAGTWLDERRSNVLDGGAPFYNTYRTLDDRAVAVGAIEPQFYAELLRGLELDPEQQPDQLDRSAWPVMRSVFAEVFATRTRDEWSVVFDGSDACVSPVLDLGEAPDHPHLRSRSTFVEVGGVRQPAPTPRFTSSDPRPPDTPVAVGGRGREALSEWGVTSALVDEWLERGLIQLADDR